MLFSKLLGVHVKFLVGNGAIVPMLVLMSQSHAVLAYTDPKHCQVYDTCYSIGQRDGFYDGQHTHVLVVVKSAAPVTIPVFKQEMGAVYSQDNINIGGDNNKVIVVQQSDNRLAALYQIV